MAEGLPEVGQLCGGAFCQPWHQRILHAAASSRGLYHGAAAAPGLAGTRVGAGRAHLQPLRHGGTIHIPAATRSGRHHNNWGHTGRCCLAMRITTILGAWHSSRACAAPWLRQSPARSRAPARSPHSLAQHSAAHQTGLRRTPQHTPATRYGAEHRRHAACPCMTLYLKHEFVPAPSAEQLLPFRGRRELVQTSKLEEAHVHATETP